MERKQTHLVYGFITALVMIIINVIIQVAKLSSNEWLPWLGFVAFLVGLILNAQAYSKANDADVTFGQVFGSCFKATALVALVTIAWGFISLAIFPEIQTMAIEKARAGMAKNPNMSQEQIEKAISFTQKNFKMFMVVGALFGTLLSGAIFSLIGAAVAKKNPRPPAQMM